MNCTDNELAVAQTIVWNAGLGCNLSEKCLNKLARFMDKHGYTRFCFKGFVATLLDDGSVTVERVGA